MATDTFSRVGNRSVKAPASPSIVYGPCLDAKVVNRVPNSPSIVYGPPVGRRERNGTTVSPCIVSAAAIRPGGVRMPSMRKTPGFVSGVCFYAAGYEPRMLNMGASGTTDGRCDERSAAGMGRSYRAEYMHSEESNTGGMDCTRGVKATAAFDDPAPSEASKDLPPAHIAGKSRDGRRRGLQGTPPKSCHGCRNSWWRVRADARGVCHGRVNVGGKKEPCQYWVCRACHKKWQGAGGAEGNSVNGGDDAFICCVHTGGRCMFRR